MIGVDGCRINLLAQKEGRMPPSTPTRVYVVVAAMVAIAVLGFGLIDDTRVD